MATLPPGRLHDVSNAADFVALTETNFEILTAEVFKQEPAAGIPRSSYLARSPFPSNDGQARSVTAAWRSPFTSVLS